MINFFSIIFNYSAKQGTVLKISSLFKVFVGHPKSCLRPFFVLLSTIWKQKKFNSSFLNQLPWFDGVMVGIVVLGELVGVEWLGSTVGAALGSENEGPKVGDNVGEFEGNAVIGNEVGEEGVGFFVGTSVPTDQSTRPKIQAGSKLS